jgi:hypothetical protein
MQKDAEELRFLLMMSLVLAARLDQAPRAGTKKKKAHPMIR